MAVYRLKRKSFTRWDETDNLKGMKDSDILAAKDKKLRDYGAIGRTAVVGGAAGLGAGALLGTVAGAGKGSWLKKRGKGLVKGSKHGLILGAAGGAAYALLKGRKTAEDNAFYNKRLKFAKQHALRRERKDWNTNMTMRDGYSY